MDKIIGLAARARSGDAQALESLLEHSAGLAWATCRARLGDSLAAQEAAVAALARVARFITKLQAAEAYPAWLRRIAARCASDHRGGRRHDDLTQVQALDARPGPVAHLLAAERRSRVRAALATLPERLREPLLLRYGEGLTHREIAAMLGTGVGTVHRRIEKAHDLLRSLLKESA